MITLNAIRKTLSQLEAKRRSLLAEMQLTADLALPLHPWKKNLGKFVRQNVDGFPPRGLWKIIALECTPSERNGDLVFQVRLEEHTDRLRRPLADVRVVALSHVESLEVLS